MRRLLDCTYSEWKNATKRERLDAIAASEGRTIVSEITLLGEPNLAYTVAELNAAFGADMLLFNFLDVFSGTIPGLPAGRGENPVQAVKELTGRMLGVNLEPVDEDRPVMGEREKLPPGRIASRETALRAREIGLDYILLTGNPGTGVTNRKIAETLREISEAVGDDLMLFAGKMHAAGSRAESGENIITDDDIRLFVEAGADVILFPAPGTVPGITVEFIRKKVALCHQLGVLTLTAVGTSQEDVSRETMEQIALMCKMTGTDLHHLGDAGYASLVPESIMTYSIAIRGKRHTYKRMALSPNR